MKTRGMTIKVKIIASFAVMIALMLIISVGAYFTLRGIVFTQNDMIHSSVMAEDIVRLVREIPDDESKYILIQTQEQKDLIDDKFTQIFENVELIRANIDDEEVLKAFESAERMLLSFSENNDKMFAQRDTTAMVTQQKLMKRYAGLVAAGVQEYLSEELNLQNSQRQILSGNTQTTGYVILGLLLLMAGISFSFAIVLSSRIGKSLDKLTVYAGDISNGDLRNQQINVKTGDEVEVLADSFHVMADNLGSVIGRIFGASEELFESANTIKVRADESALAIEQIATNTQEGVEGAQNQVEEAEKTDHAVQELIQLNHNINAKSETVLQATREAMNLAEEGNDKVVGMMSQMDAIKERVGEIQGTIEALKDNSEQIQNIVDTINSISESTNLLALNASIEAARAGEAGRGFAVVADEIRKLATSSADSTGEISAILGKIQTDVKDLTGGMDKVVGDVMDGNDKVSQVRDSFDQIVTSNSNVDTEIKDISMELQNMAAEVDRIEGISKGICDISLKSLDGSTDISAVVEEQLATQEDFAQSAETLTAMASELKSLISQFQVD